jgi:hypothetical protein
MEAAMTSDTDRDGNDAERVSTGADRDGNDAEHATPDRSQGAEPPAADSPVQASDPRSVTVDRGGGGTGSPGAEGDAAAAEGQQ